MASSSKQPDVLIVNRSNQQEDAGGQAYEVVAAHISGEQKYDSYAEAREVAERSAEDAAVDVWYQPDLGRDEVLLVASFREPRDA